MYTKEELQEIGRRVVMLPFGSYLNRSPKTGDWEVLTAKGKTSGSLMDSLCAAPTLGGHWKSNSPFAKEPVFVVSAEDGWVYCQICGCKRALNALCSNNCFNPCPDIRQFSPDFLALHGDTPEKALASFRLSDNKMSEMGEEPEWMAQADKFFAHRFLPTEELKCEADPQDSRPPA